MGPPKQPPFSGQSPINTFDTFFIIKRISGKDENFSNVSPFLVEKAITGGVGTVTSTKLMRSGDLLVEVASRKQAQQILKLNSLSTVAISVQPHVILNTSKCVITCGRLLNLPNEEITQELGGQGVKDVWRINIRRDGASRASVLAIPKQTAAGHLLAPVVQRLATIAPIALLLKNALTVTASTLLSLSCPKWKVEKEIVATKFKNNISFPEARRLVKAPTPPDGKSYASVVEKSHPVYQTTNCPHCNHLVTMFNPVPSTSKSPEPGITASSSGTKNRNILPKPSSQTSAIPPDSQDSSDKNKTSTDKTANSTSESSEGNSSDTDSDITLTSAPEVSNTQKNRARSKSEKSQKLKAKRGLSRKDLPAKLKKSVHHNSVALGLADRGIVHKDLPSIFGGVPQVPYLKLHPSDEHEDLQMD
ncbi:hypothetical protein AVEN_115806-1 [Araneus ventricosus]|uniref:Uncharacterized protein n=1 Tax=Araneus ventricosus TaxID=182803 RepID=A0A4Y2USP7_ARAVE|nr:hypothetical protein AVEN_115806-1 [Araneus ventricosus]